MNPHESAAHLAEQLSCVPRFRLITGETPIQRLPGISRRVGRPVFVKRDDLTGLAFGGNKVRQAEFFVGQALAEGADTILAGGSFAQSNHARVLAAAARAAGLGAVILVRPGGGVVGRSTGGNALITRLLAVEVRVAAALADAPAEDRDAEIAFRRSVFAEEATRLRSQGRKPFVVLGSSTPLGTLGYVSAALELHRQSMQFGLRFGSIYLTSLGATHAGLELGARLLGDTHEIVGVAYQPVPRTEAEATVGALAEAAAQLLGLPMAERAVHTEIGEAGGAYGETTPSSRRALALAAEADGLLLDPTYTAKGFAAMLRDLERADASDEPVLFVHTGGLPALFARAPEDLAG